MKALSGHQLREGNDNIIVEGLTELSLENLNDALKVRTLLAAKIMCL